MIFPRLKIWFLRKWEFDSPQPYHKAPVRLSGGVFFVRITIIICKIYFFALKSRGLKYILNIIL